MINCGAEMLEPHESDVPLNPREGQDYIVIPIDGSEQKVRIWFIRENNETIEDVKQIYLQLYEESLKENQE